MSVAKTSLAIVSLETPSEDTLRKFVTTKNVKQNFAKRDTPEAANSLVNLEGANLENSVDFSI